MVQYPTQLKQAFDKGHQICIHTWAHRALTSMTTSVVVTDLEWTLRIVQEVTGVRPKCLRPPYGDIDDRVRAIVKAMGLTVYLWNYDTSDYLLNTTPGSVNVAGNAKNYAAGWNSRSVGVVSLEHDYTVATASQAKPLIEGVKSQGMIPMSIEQCLGGSVPPPVLGISTNGKCGPIEKTKCPNNQCCSKYNYCGVNSANCETGCQTLYGRCGMITTTTTSSGSTPTNLPVSINGKCGPIEKTKCPNNQCCSKYNYCGVNSANCETGCQTLYGRCGMLTTTTTSASSTPTNMPVSINGKCGPIEKTICPSTKCCSKYNYCRVNSANCDAGCQPLYGRCNTATTLPVSTNGQCGPDQKTICPNTDCCSQYNYCGTSLAHCTTGCQPLYGKCT